MKKVPVVSVIISNYNCADYIGRTLESIQAQTFQNWEAVVIDDGSTDASSEVIWKYARRDERIRPFILKENQGMCSGFNYAISQAQGKYLARLDSDDFWEPTKLEKQLEYMEAHPECGVCFTWVRVVDESEKEVPESLCENRAKIYNSENRSRAEWLRTFFFEGCRVCHPTAVIRKEALDSVGGRYDYILKQVQDYELWIRIAKKYDIHVIPEILLNYRWFLGDKKNASASSNKVQIRSLAESFLIFSQFNDGIDDNTFKEAFREDMFFKNAESHEELLCERALIMYHKSYLGNTGRMIGLQMLQKLFNNDITREILKKYYGITTKTFAEWTEYHIFSDTVMGEVGGCVEQEITFKAYMKQKLSTHPKLYNMCAKVYKQFKRG